MRTKYNDIEKANLAYRKQRKHTHKQTRKMIMRLLASDVTENEKIGSKTEPMI